MSILKRHSGFMSAVYGFSCMLILSLTFAPRIASARATVTTLDFGAIVLVPCANEGNGELVALQFTLRLVERIDDNPFTELGVWTAVTGIGLVTGDTYRGVTVSTRIPDSDEYLTNISLNGSGPDGAHFTLTRFGPLFGPPSEVIQVHCSW